MRAERTHLMNKKQEEKIRELVKQQEAEHENSVKNTKRIVELITKSKENLEANMKFEAENKASFERDKICLAALVFIWIGIVVYTNYFMGATPSYASRTSGQERTDF